MPCPPRQRPTAISPLLHPPRRLQIAWPLAFGLALLFSGPPGMAIPLLVLAGLAALVFYWWRNEIALASSLLGVSAHGLVANPHLITTTVFLNLLSLLAVAPLLVFEGMEYICVCGLGGRVAFLCSEGAAFAPACSGVACLRQRPAPEQCVYVLPRLSTRPLTGPPAPLSLQLSPS